MSNRLRRHRAMVQEETSRDGSRLTSTWLSRSTGKPRRPRFEEERVAVSARGLASLLDESLADVLDLLHVGLQSPLGTPNGFHGAFDLCHAAV